MQLSFILRPSLKSFFALGGLLFALVSCNNNDDPDPIEPEPTATIAELVADGDQFSILESALEQAGLTSTFAGSDEYTVFAPTDQAFQSLLDSSDEFESLEDISTESLAALLQYHVASGTVLSSDLSDGQTVATLLSGETLIIGVDGSTVTVNDATVTEADIEATNGVVHAIDQVLVPEGFVLEPAEPNEPEQSIAAIAAGNENLSSLVAALERFPDLLAAASDEEATLTVFAPTDEAFANLLTTLSDVLGTTLESQADIPDYVLERVLSYHILASAKTAEELEANEATLAGDTLSINTSEGVVINEEVNVVADLANIEASNGVVHVIDAVLLPPLVTASLGTVLQPALFDAEGRFTTLITALETAELVPALTDAEATLTVFAPTNEAFDAFIVAGGLDNVEALLAAENLGEILQYHVLGSTIPSGDIPANNSAVSTLLENREIYISNNGEEGIFLNANAQVIVPDLETDNGVVHGINGVLLPPVQSVADIAITASQDADNPEFTLLVAALQNADDTDGSLVELLQQEDTQYTVFAPTDQAFIDAGFADVEAIEAADPVTLRNILLYHVVAGNAVLSTDLTEGEVTTANGTITISLGDAVTIADANADNVDATVLTPNVLGTNGVVHVIDQVLLPE